MTVKIFSHNAGSAGAAALADALGVRRVRHTGSRVNLTGRDTLINWGHAGELPAHVRNSGRIINRPDNVRLASNKLRAFETMHRAGVRVVPFTTDITTAQEWGSKVVCRHTLNGHSGAGIEIIEPGLDIPDAPCYTKYIVKDSEWRIHVVAGQVIDATRKIRDPAFVGEPNWAIRNREGGFIFARNSGHPSAETSDQARAAVEACGLDFGAVDVMVSRSTRAHPDVLSYVLEINTAPGLVGTTVERYSEAFKQHYGL